MIGFLPSAWIRRVFSEKHPGVKVFSFYFKKFFDHLEAVFVMTAHITFEKYNFLSLKQKDRESYEQIW